MDYSCDQNQFYYGAVLPPPKVLKDLTNLGVQEFWKGVPKILSATHFWQQNNWNQPSLVKGFIESGN